MHWTLLRSLLTPHYPCLVKFSLGPIILKYSTQPSDRIAALVFKETSTLGLTPLCLHQGAGHSRQIHILTTMWNSALFVNSLTQKQATQFTGMKLESLAILSLQYVADIIIFVNWARQYDDDDDI